MNTKKILILGGLGLVAIIFLPKMFGKLVDGFRANKSAKSTAKELEKGLKDSGLKQTISPLGAKVMADQLYGAMKGAGTDEAKIAEILGKAKNSLDLLAISRAFGVREGENLSGWIRGEGSIPELFPVMTKWANDPKNFPPSQSQMVFSL